jgi:hypothetical protein
MNFGGQGNPANWFDEYQKELLALLSFEQLAALAPGCLKERNRLLVENEELKQKVRLLESELEVRRAMR